MRIRLSDLNPPQREAVTTIHGPLLVLAGAGSGKTRVITYRIAHLLEQGIRPENILAVSFTNKAAEEMRERVERLCPPKEARLLTLSTFHSLGLLILKAERAALGLSSGFTIYDTSDQLGVIREILRDAHVADRRLEIKAILSRISRCKNAMLTPQLFLEQLRKARFVSEYDGFTAEVYPRYVDRMRALHAFDFDDLLVETLRLLTENDKVRARWQSRFRYLMIDEYQDTNRCQLDFLRLLCEQHGNLAVVGDDDQSIYGWRGAEARNILEFAQQFPGAKVIKLEENYRSTPPILRAANAVIEKNKTRHGKTLWTSREGGEPIDLVAAPDEQAEATFVAETIDYLVAHKRFQLRDIAILYRATKQSEAIEEALRQAHIEYHVIGGTAFFERKEVKDAIAYLKLLAYPHDEIALRRVINYPARGLGPTAMQQLSAVHKQAQQKHKETSLWQVLCALAKAETAKAGAQGGLFAPAPAQHRESEEDGAAVTVDEVLSDRARSTLAQFVDRVQRFRAHLQQGGAQNLKELADRYLREMGVHDDLTRSGPTALMAERRHRNLSDFLSNTQRYAEKAGPDFELMGYLNRLSISASEEDADDGLRDSVTLSTLHGSKGLEFRVVFFIGLEEELLPHKRSLYPREADQTLASAPQPSETGSDGEGPPSADIDEERRLCYVGITRARERLFISWCRQRNGRLDLRYRSRFLDDIPEDVLRLRDLEGPPPKIDPQDEERVAREMIERMKALSA